MYAQALQLAARLNAHQVPDPAPGEDPPFVDTLRAYTDPDKAASNRPCVLVVPPRIDWRNKSATWTLVVLTSHATGSETAWKQLDATLALVAAVLDVEAATPSAYYLTADYPQVASYLATFTTTHA